MDPQYDHLIEPSRIPFSFGAPGWWVLGAVLLLLLALVVWLIIRHRRHNRYRRKALALLEQCADLYSANMLLKHVAMTVYPRSSTAALRAADWIAFLNSTRHKPLFDANDANALAAMYNREQLPAANAAAAPNTAAAAFRNKAREWIKQHRHAL